LAGPLDLLASSSLDGLVAIFASDVSVVASDRPLGPLSPTRTFRNYRGSLFDHHRDAVTASPAGDAFHRCRFERLTPYGVGLSPFELSTRFESRWPGRYASSIIAGSFRLRRLPLTRRCARGVPAWL